MRSTSYKNTTRLSISASFLSFDKTFFYIVITLMTIGVFAVAESSAPTAIRVFDDRYHFLKSHLQWLGLGIILMSVSSLIHYKYWEKVAVGLFGVSLVLLIIVMIPGVGVHLLGARRWINLGSFSFQPSEVVKLAMAIYIAKLAEKDKSALAFFVPVGLVCFLIMLQPDLGTTIVVAGIAMMQIFMSGIPILVFLGVNMLGVFSGLILILSSDYRRSRLMTYLQSSVDPLGESYHIRQILFALGSGGMFGLGIGQSRQKYLYLPEATSDSIFAIIAEELGFVGASLLIILFFLFVVKGLRIANNAPDSFSKILGIGIITWIGGQALLNFSAMVALVPLTGIPLPFISTGGSSLVMICFATGILLNISKHSVKQGHAKLNLRSNVHSKHKRYAKRR